MLPNNDTIINNILSFSYLDEYKIIKPCYKLEVFEGSIYEWQSLNSNVTWKTLECSSLTINRNAGQASTLNATFSASEFYKPNSDIINYDFNKGTYTHINGTVISKGFIVRAYIGYFKDINDKRYILKFTGIIDSISIDDNDNVVINASDFTVLFLNSLNYNYPNVKSYQDIPFQTTNLSLLNSIDNVTDTFNVSLDTSDILKIGQRIQIDNEVMVITYKLNKPSENKTELKVKRLMNIGSHNYGRPIKVFDDLIVVPDEIYTDNLSNRYVPAYDNWRLDYAIRDLCIKAKFPLSLLSFDYNDIDKIRLMAGEKYPYMQSKSVYERVSDTSLLGLPNSNYNASDVYVEKKYYIGIDENMLNEAKYKLDFGINLWDAINRLLEAYSLRAFFNEEGKLVIKGLRQYKWLKPNENNNVITLIENHVLSWVAWNLNNYTNKMVTFVMPNNVRNVKAKFVTSTTPSDTVTVKFLRYNNNQWQLVGENTVPALGINTSVEIPLYEAFDGKTDILPVGTYAVKLETNTSMPPLLNGLLYLDNTDESVVWRYDAINDAYVSNVVNTADNVRNKITIIGLPESPQPIVTQAIDYTSMLGGTNVISSLVVNGIDIGSAFTSLNNTTFRLIPANTPITINASKTINYINLSLRNIDIDDVVNIKIYTSTPSNPLVNINVGFSSFTSQGVWIYIPAYSQQATLKIIFDKTVNLCYLYGLNIDRSFNFIGSLRETIVVKKNISDKASADVLVYNQIDIHRKNINNITANILPNPYLQVFDCVTVNAGFMGVYNTVKAWITGYTINMSYNECRQTLTLQNVPPVESYTVKPSVSYDIVGGDPNQIYDFSITRKKSSTHEELETVYGLDYDLKLNENITSITTSFSLYGANSGYNLSSKIIRINSEFMIVNSYTYSYNNGKHIYSVNVTRDFYNTGSIAHSKDSVVYISNILSNFDPPNEYLTFNFALPEQRKVQVRVGVMFRNQTLAYIMEEKILSPGVYKRENGIRWDGGIDFAKVWTDSVNKIYLPPNNRYNYMYNRMFHPGADSRWEDPKYNFYFWAFNNDIKLDYPVVGSASATSAGWVKTPPLYDAMIISKPVLSGFYGSTSLVPTNTKYIWLTSKLHEHKLIIKDPIPIYVNKNSYIPVSIPVAIMKDGVYSEINDSVYFDAYVSTYDGGNVNLINAPKANPETPRRWVVPIGLNQIIQWDFTDSQGKVVRTAPYPGYGYKITIVNAFDIYGEGVEVIKDYVYNIVNGDLNITNAYDWQNKFTSLGWSIIAQGIGDSFDIKDGVALPFSYIADTYNYTNLIRPIVKVKVNYLSSGGHTNNDAFLEYSFTKNVKTIGWDSNKHSAPAGLYYTLNPIYKVEGDMYFRMFFKPKYQTGSIMMPQGVTLTDVWRPFLVLKYINANNEHKVKSIPLTFNGSFNVWNSCSLILTNTHLSDVLYLKSIGIEFRILDNNTPQAFHDLKAFTSNTYFWMFLGVDSIELGKGTIIPQNYQAYQNDYRSSKLFYFYE